MKIFRIAVLALLCCPVLPLCSFSQTSENTETNSLSVGENSVVLQSEQRNSVLVKGKNENILITNTQNFESSLIPENTSSAQLKFIIYTHAYEEKAELPGFDGNENLTLVFQENSYRRFSASNKHEFTVVTAGNRLTIKTANEDIELIHLPGAHTDGDLAVYLKKSNLLYTGNLFYPASFPYINIEAEGTVRGYLDAVNELIKLSDKKTVIVPAIGTVSGIKSLEEFQKMFKNSKNRIELLTLANKSLQEIINEKPLNDFIDNWENGNITSEDFIQNLYEGTKKRK